MTNMNQLISNMNQMNSLINQIGNNQINNDNFNIFNNLNNFNNIINFSIPNKHDFVIVFENQDNLEKYLINCNSKDKLSDVIKKYELKAGINDKRQYVYNSQLLNVNETVENLGIPYSGRVLVIDLENIRGG